MYRLNIKNLTYDAKEEILAIIKKDKRIHYAVISDEVEYKKEFKLTELEVGDNIEFYDGTLLKSKRFLHDYEIRRYNGSTPNDEHEFITVIKNLEYLKKEKVNENLSREPTVFTKLNTANRWLGQKARVIRVGKGFITLDIESVAGGTRVYRPNNGGKYTDKVDPNFPDREVYRFDISETYITKKKVRVDLELNDHL